MMAEYGFKGVKAEERKDFIKLHGHPVGIPKNGWGPKCEPSWAASVDHSTYGHSHFPPSDSIHIHKSSELLLSDISAVLLLFLSSQLRADPNKLVNYFIEAEEFC